MPSLRNDRGLSAILSPLNPRLHPILQADGTEQEAPAASPSRRSKGRSPERDREVEDEEASPTQLLRQRTLDAHARPAASPAAAARRLLDPAWPERRAGLNAMGLVVRTGGRGHLQFDAPATVLEAHASPARRPLGEPFAPSANGPRAATALFRAPLQIGRDGRDAASAQAWYDRAERERVVASYDLRLPEPADAPAAVPPLVRCFPHAPRTEAEEGVIARWQKRNMKATSELLFKGTQMMIRRTARLRMQQYGLLPRLVTLGDADVLTSHPFDAQAYRARRLQAANLAGSDAAANKRPVVLVYADTAENRQFLREENEFLARYAMTSLHLDAGNLLAGKGPVSLISFPGLKD